MNIKEMYIELLKKTDRQNHKIDELQKYKNFVMLMISKAYVADCAESGSDKFLQEFIGEYEKLK